MPVELRVLALLSNMTMEEKISQLSSNSAAISRLQIPAFNWWTGEASQLLAMVSMVHACNMMLCVAGH